MGDSHPPKKFMPPLLSLLLCTGFVLILLRVESRPSSGVSTALWIPTFWMLMIASRSLGGWFGMTEGNDSGSSLDRLVLSGLSIAGIVVLSRRRFDWSGTLRRHRWLLVLLTYMFISTFWSDITFIALKRWIREVIVVIMALVIMSEANPRRALESVLRRSAYVLIPFSFMLIKYYPALGRQYGRWSGIEMWTGVTAQKNGLGRLCMISVFFLLCSLYQWWRERASVRVSYQPWADISVLLIALVLFKGADSSTSLASLVVGVATFLGLCLFQKLKLMAPKTCLLALMILLIGFGVSAPFLGGSNVAIFSSSLGRDETLTGRTEVWAAVLPVVKQHPLLGSGFGSFWTDARRQLYEIPTAHNGYLDILLELGAVGLAFCTMWLLSCARQLHRALSQDYDWASIAICFLIMGLVYNNTESALNSLTEHMTAVVVLTSLVVPARLRTRKCASTAGVRSSRSAPALQLQVTTGMSPHRSGRNS
jgi:exopolysaccharide production protein ExoQ